MENAETADLCQVKELKGGILACCPSKHTVLAGQRKFNFDGVIEAVALKLDLAKTIPRGPNIKFVECISWMKDKTI